MKNLLPLLLIFFGINLSTAQDRWYNFTKADGLTSNVISDVLIENNASIWVATDSGLNHIDQSIVKTFTTANSNLPSNRIFELAWYNGNLALITDLGLSLFNGTSFINYTTGNGLLNNTVKGMAADQSGNLWLAFTNGVSRFDGTQFFNDSSKVAHSIAVDSSNRVYILRYSAVFDIPSFTQPIYEVYDGTSWSSPATNRFVEIINSSELHLARNGQLMIRSKGSQAVFAKLSYPFNLEIIKPEANNQKISAVSTVELSNTGKTWLGSRSLAHNLLVGQDSTFESFAMIQPFVSQTSIDVNDGIVVSGGENGVYLASESIHPTESKLEIDVNSIRTNIEINGPFFNKFQSGEAGFEFPKGNNSYGIYSANFIVASKASGNPNFHVSPMDPFWLTYTPGPITNGTAILNQEYIVKVSKAEIDAHKLNYSSAGYTMPNGIENWPARGDSSLGIAQDLAPFFDVNSNGCYDPMNGDYPAILGDEAIYWINHPNVNLDHLEYHGMLYGYNSTNAALDQTLYLKYRIINRSNQLLDSVKVGFYMDADLGNPADDYVGCDSIHNIAYAYNGDSFDESVRGQTGYGNNPPALGVKFLSDSMDTHVFYNIGGGQNGDPTTPSDWVYLLEGRTVNGSSKYAFTGDPFLKIGRTEENPAPGANSIPPGDRRSLSSIPYFSLPSGGEKVIDLAIGYGLKDSISQFAENVPEMVSILNQAKVFYDNQNYTGFVYGSNTNCIITSINESVKQEAAIEVFPNPSTGFLRINSSKGIAQLELFDIKGSRVFNTGFNAEKQMELKLPTELPNGFYFLQVLDTEGELQTKKLILQR